MASLGTQAPLTCPAFGASPRRNVRIEETVEDCYDFFDRVFLECGLLDLTDGVYHGDPTTPYEQAQTNQLNWLLDQVECTAGSRILDVGCGNGTLLEEARKRGAKAVGITISGPQVKCCRSRGFDVRLLDYRCVGPEWDGQFDGIVANGSIEHFVQPRDAIAGRQDAIYRELFQICHRLIDPESQSGKLATTVIHFDRVDPDPKDLLRSPLAFVPFSDKFHTAVLERTMGGYYPRANQLQQCSSPYFRLSAEVDGTVDYHLTSEEWLRRVRRGFLHPKTLPRLFTRLVPYLLQRPRHCMTALSMLITASWQWQFRGKEPPTRLLRHVWEYRRPADGAKGPPTSFAASAARPNRLPAHRPR